MKKSHFLWGLVTTTLLLSTPLSAKEWALLPVLKKDFKFDFTAAVTAGQALADHSTIKSTDLIYGGQLSFNCPWFDVGFGDLRTHFNYEQYNMTTTSPVHSFQINPHWYLGKGLTVGVGPGAGYIWSADASQSMWSAQAFGDIEYRIGFLFMGAGVRYQWTEGKSIGTFPSGMDALLVQAKIGVNLY